MRITLLCIAFALASQLSALAPAPSFDYHWHQWSTRPTVGLFNNGL